MDDETPPDIDVGTKGRAIMLGYAGLAPFVVLAAWLYGIHQDHPWRAITITLLLSYSAVVLSFLGGARWASALHSAGPRGPRDLALSVLPAVVGWIAMVLPLPFAFAILAVAFAAQGAWDAFVADGSAFPVWYGQLRARLTTVVVATMIVAFFATA